MEDVLDIGVCSTGQALVYERFKIGWKIELHSWPPMVTIIV